ncbi:hypothetical protein Rrhod_0437 [Rhodococcus rhodnii LMG 5362]|uniref:Uncharacterized protein n=1 Tax=Rhodococcus rhodnii LMG 5362 TaxID=1273125 RepID=R7WSG6_9NOCA|nr:hypothetical protein Rrhod_0437 [Rhodococcus rhodnii LMG 5362]
MTQTIGKRDRELVGLPAVPAICGYARRRRASRRITG